METYRYVLENGQGNRLEARGVEGTLEEAHRLAKGGQWVLSYPVRVWCTVGSELPDTSLAAGVIEAPREPEPVPTPPVVPDAPPTPAAVEPAQASTLTVDFASAKAAELADELNLTAADFEGMEPSGKTGFTIRDVQEAAAVKELATT